MSRKWEICVYGELQLLMYTLVFSTCCPLWHGQHCVRDQKYMHWRYQFKCLHLTCRYSGWSYFMAYISWTIKLRLKWFLVYTSHKNNFNQRYRHVKWRHLNWRLQCIYFWSRTQCWPRHRGQNVLNTSVYNSNCSSLYTMTSIGQFNLTSGRGQVKTQ